MASKYDALLDEPTKPASRYDALLDSESKYDALLTEPKNQQAQDRATMQLSGEEPFNGTAANTPSPEQIQQFTNLPTGFTTGTETPGRTHVGAEFSTASAQDPLVYLPRSEGKGVGAGILNSGANLTEAMMSPLGLAAMVVTPALPVIAQRVVAGAFAADMGYHLPGQAKEATEALTDPNATTAKKTEKVLDATLGLAMTAAGAAHAAGVPLLRPRAGGLAEGETPGNTARVGNKDIGDPAKPLNLPASLPASPETKAVIEPLLKQNSVLEEKVRLGQLGLDREGNPTIEPTGLDLPQNLDRRRNQAPEEVGQPVSDVKVSTVEPSRASESATAETTPAEPVAPEVQAPEPAAPAKVKFRDFDERGRLAKEVELPLEEAGRVLRGRKSVLETLKGCLG